MAKHAYLIMAHNQWEQLELLLKCLDDARNDIFLHIDRKAVGFPRKEIDMICKSSRLFYTKQYDIRWGGTKMMICEMEMIRAAVKTGKYAYLHLISGVDLPIKSQDYIHDFCDDHIGYEFLAFDWKNIETGAFNYRCQYYHLFTNKIGRYSKKTLLQMVLKKINAVSLKIQHKMKVDRLKGKTYYKGSQWFSITGDCAEYILAHEREIEKRFRFCLNPDEGFIQTIIKESPEGLFRLAPGYMRYILWTKEEPSPDTLTMQHFKNMKESSEWFARKFDWGTDRKVFPLRV